MNHQGIILVQHEANKKSGIGKKILAQKKALSIAGIDSEICSLITDESGKYHARLVGDQIVEIFQTKWGLDKRLTWIWSYSEIVNYIESRNLKFLYIRYTHFANPFFLNFLRKLKKLRVAIYLEIPTYPYDSEYKDLTLKRSLHLGLERMCRNEFHRFVDKVVTYSQDSKIFGIETIVLDNGVDLDEIPCRKPKKTLTSEIRIIVVSSFEFWHGYDRLIRGLANYKQQSTNQKNIHIEFVGYHDTGVGAEYKKLISAHNIEENFTWHGYLTGRPLDDLFNGADIAIGVLGGHRKGLCQFKSLKNREYCARGMPFAYSSSDPSFDGETFALQLPSDESPIDISRLLKWLDEQNGTTESIRRYAEKTLSWNDQMAKVAQDFILKAR